MVADGNCVSLPLHINQKLRLFHFLSSLCILIPFFCSSHSDMLGVSQSRDRQRGEHSAPTRIQSWALWKAQIYIIKAYIFFHISPTPFTHPFTLHFVFLHEDKCILKANSFSQMTLLSKCREKMCKGLQDCKCEESDSNQDQTKKKVQLVSTCCKLQQLPDNKKRLVYPSACQNETDEKLVITVLGIIYINVFWQKVSELISAPSECASD